MRDASIEGAAKATVTALERSVRVAEVGELHARFAEQGGFVDLPELLGPTDVAALAAFAEAEEPRAHRGHVPGFKRSGSLGRTELDQAESGLGEMYHGPVLRPFLEGIVGAPLHACPPWDRHAYALYYYTEAGDHIGWHYDTSFYKGARYTLLVGLVDESSARLECRLHRRSRRAEQALSVALRPGRMVFFDGDAVWHRVTPVETGERRICLAIEFVTDPRMSWVSRVVSNVKDTVGYFGFGGRS